MYKNTITNIKLEQLVNCEDLDTAVKALQLQQPWILPQAAAYVAEHWKPQLVNNQYSALATLEPYSDLWSRGLWTLLTTVKRSLLVPKQATEAGAHYCALVPLVLMAYKKYHNIPYEAWNRDELRYVVDKNLLAAMLCDIPQLSAARLLELRQQGLTYTTGAQAGQQRSATSNWRLYNISKTELGELPILAQTMLTQIWCAHPQLRNNYMVLDPQSWDHMPTPLIVENIFVEPQKPVKPSVECVSPWD